MYRISWFVPFYDQYNIALHSSCKSRGLLMKNSLCVWPYVIIALGKYSCIFGNLLESDIGVKS